MGKRLPVENMDFMFHDFLGLFMSEDVFLDLSFDSSETEEEVDYLKRGERLESLARTIYQRRIGKMTLTDAEQKIYSISMDETMSYFDIVHKISKSFTRPCLRSMVSSDDEYAKALLDAVSLPSLHIALSFVDEQDSVRGYVCRSLPQNKRTEASNEPILCVSFEEDGYPSISYHGYKNISHSKKDLAWKCVGNPVRVVDLADFFSSLIIYSQVMKKVSAYIAGDDDAQVDETTLSLKKEVEEYTSTHLLRGIVRICPDELNLQGVSDVFKYVVRTTDTWAQDVLFRRLVADGMVLDVPCTSPWKWRESLASYGPSIGVRNADNFAACFLFWYDNVFSYHRFLHSTTDIGLFYWGLPQGLHSSRTSKITDSDIMELFKKLFFVVYKEKVEQKSTLDYYRELESGEHAKSYQLKKAIPKRVLDAMEKSLFNEYFGFVEFDDEADTDKAEEIAKEFRALKEKYLRDINSSENAIRFRKLGNHKALGLYYPSVKCLCVDIHSPESLVHEYGHLIDYTMGGLSDEKDFRMVKAAYVDYLHAQMEENSAVKAVMKGKTKYNLTYYSRSTEVFARCFELYVSKVLEVNNSIVPQSFNESVYPQTDEFLKLVADYFNALLHISPKEEEDVLTETVRWLISCPAGDGNFMCRLKNATEKEIRLALKDEKVASQKAKVAKLNAQLRKIACA